MFGTQETSPTNCIFCYKNIFCNKIEDHDDSTEVKKFIVFVQRHLGKRFCGEFGKRESNPVLLTQLTDVATFDFNYDICQDCMVTVKSFNQLYHQLKCLELQVNWRIEELRLIMTFADKVPSRVKSIREERSAKNFQKILNFRRAFKKRSQRIPGCLRVELDRFDKEPVVAASTGSSPTPNLSSPLIIQTSSIIPHDECPIPDLGDPFGDESSSVAGGSINIITEENTIITVGNDLPPLLVKFESDPMTPCATQETGSHTIIPEPTTHSFSLDCDENLESESAPHFDILLPTLEESSTPAQIIPEIIMECEVEIDYPCNYKLESSNPLAEVVSPNNSSEEIPAIVENITAPPTQHEEAVQPSSEMTGESDLPLPSDTGELGANQTRRLRKLHKCTVCSLTFSNSQRLEAHIESAHNESECSGSDNSEHDNSGEDDDEEYTASPAKIPKRSKVDNDELFEENVSDFSDESYSSHEEEEELSDMSMDEKVVVKIKPRPKRKSSSASNREAEGSQKLKETPLKIEDKVRTLVKKEKSDKGPFTCSDCLRRFTRLNALRYHAASKHRPADKRLHADFPITADGVTMSIRDWCGKKRAKFTCKNGDCKEKFMSDYALQKHSKLHGEFPCNFCSKTFTFAPDLAVHELEHSDSSFNTNKTEDSKTIVKCARCSYKSQYRERYVDHHLGDHLGGLKTDRVRCPICKSASTSCGHDVVSGLLLHYMNHHDLYGKDPNDIQKCGQCSAYFMNEMQLDTHITKVHQERNKFPCADCNAVFSRKKLLVSHRLKVHKKSGELSFACDVDEDCKKRYETQVQLDRHKIFMHSEKSSMLMCTQCGKKFLGKAALLRHMITHKEKVQENSRRFVCELCGKAYIKKEQLNVHMMFHAGPDSWKYSCSVCKKKIISEQKLNEHMRTHTKEKPFVCQVCGEKYAHRHNFKNHMKSKHGIDVAIRKLEDTTLFASTRKGKKLKKV